MKRILAVTPSHLCDAQIAIAACRAGQVGILDLGTSESITHQRRMIGKLAKFAGRAGLWGVRWDSLAQDSRTLSLLANEVISDPISIIVLAGLAKEQMEKALVEGKRLAKHVIAEVITKESALEAQALGFHGVVVKGNEAGGAVSPQTSFLLQQQLHERLTIPYWVQGGVCLHTAPATLIGGAYGVVLSEQLWLTDEAPFHERERNVWHHLDGSETVLIGCEEEQFRFFNRSGKAKLEEFSKGIVRNSNWKDPLRQHLTTQTSEPLIAMGQDIAFGASLANQYGTVGRIITAFRNNLRSQIEIAQTQNAFSPDSSLAQTHKTQYPIVQGPMTRVSDVAPFAKAVGEGGGLPFLALAVLRKFAVRPLLQKTQELMKGRPWGVGILGFVPPELRQEQLAVIKDVKPPFAIISGGRPHQARELEELGTSTYLHVPSPGLLAAFVKDGTRKFIFEGNECGGHTGPRSSFILWGIAVETLLQSKIDDYENIQILFAGGIHDALSAAMVSIIAAPLVARGVKVGVLMGTAYLFTEEIVQAGAIVPEFQTQAVDCEKTDLLHSGLGYSTRCAHTPFCDDFNKVRDTLIATGNPNDKIREELERFNLGRLRIASKGITRSTQSDPQYTEVNREIQVQEGMYMIGEVATLRNQTFSIGNLHAEISLGGHALLQKVSLPEAELTVIHADQEREDIAIVGMAAMFPKAPDVRSFWHNILNGVDAVEEVSPKRWDANLYFDENRFTPDKTYSKWGGFLGDVQFNPLQYGLPPVSLSSIDSTQLLALEVSRRALQDAGYLRLPFPKERTSVIFGTGGSHDLGTSYGFRVLLPQYLSRIHSLSKETYEELLASLYENLPKWSEDSFPGILANVVAGRVANRLDLGGSNFTVEAACASSLAALDVGIDQLRLRKTDVALVGTVDCTNNPVAYMSFAKTHALSPRGRCRPFDASADGIVISEGVAALVIRRLSDAERDGDRIYAILKGMGSSSDGRNRSLTAPHPDGQVRAVRRAYEDAGVLPGSVELVEAHGTGTSVGDKSEIEALKLSFNGAGTQPQYCAIGSVKSMIGHTKMAAGLAGIIKGTLAIRNHVIPPTIGVETPNANISFGSTPFYISTEPQPWFDRRHRQPRRCGVSAFGFGGTNFHAVLEEYQGSYRNSDCSNLSHRDAEIFTFGSATREEMQEKISQLRSRLEFPECLEIASLAKAIHEEEITGKHELNISECRLAIVAHSAHDLKDKLELAQETLLDHTSLHHSKGLYYQEGQPSGKVCFLFTGQGSQKVNMGRELLIAFPELQEVIEEADAILEARFSKPLSRLLYPIPVFSDAERKAQQMELNNTHVAQPALAAADLIGLEALKKFGLKPDCVGGHSFGEFVALCAAGVLSRTDLFHLAESRGRISSEAAKHEPGTMAAVQTNEEETQRFITDHNIPVNLANMNSPSQTIIAGANESIKQAVLEFNNAHIGARELPVTAPFHTPGMSGAGEKLSAELQLVQFQNPNCPVYSNTLGGLYPQALEEMRKVLVRHICEPVRFMDEVHALYESGVRIFIEVGPGRVLGNLVDHILKDQSYVSLSLEGKGRTGTLGLCDVLGQAWAHGLSVEVSRWFEQRDLPNTSLNELLEEARTTAQPPATMWRLNGGGGSPWSQNSLSREERNGKGAKKVQKSSDITISQSTTQVDTHKTKGPVIGERKVQMNKNNLKQEQEQVQPQSSGGNQSAPIISQIQASMNQFMDLQRHNQQLMQRYLDLQEQLIEAAVDGRRLKMMNVEIPAGHQMRHDNPISEPNSPQPLAVPPAPVLPILKETVEEPPKKKEPIIQAVEPPPTVPEKEVTSQAIPKEHSEEDGPFPSTENFKVALLQTVSDRTGYPQEMLDLHANLEADLGIDSIKLIEILTTLEDYREMLEGQEGADSMEELTNLKTLQDMVDWYDHTRKKKLNLPREGVEISPSVSSKDRNDGTDIRRSVVNMNVALKFPPNSSFDFPKNDIIILIGEPSFLSEFIKERLVAQGFCVKQVVSSKLRQPVGLDLIHGDFSSEETLEPLRAVLSGPGERVGGIINVMGLSLTDTALESRLDESKITFLLLKLLEQDIRESAEHGGGIVVNITALDGYFGLQNPNSIYVGAAGTIGVCKSVAREWANVRVKCIDLEILRDPELLSSQVWNELCTWDGHEEIGLSEEGRGIVERVDTPIGHDELDSLPLDSQSVILLLGGGYGITAEVGKALASQYQPHLVIVGRSICPEKENTNTAALNTPHDLRQYFIKESQSSHQAMTPAEIEKHIASLLRQREIRLNLSAMRKAGSKVTYHALDVRDSVALGKLVDSLYSENSSIQGVIHSAGIIDDKLIQKKSSQSFDAVMDTKIIPALVLEKHLRPEGLHFVLFFSSIAARYGNAGQTDYSAANEVLNKMAGMLCGVWPQVKVASLNWGPWAGGMVDASLQKKFENKGIGIISMEEGVRYCLDEMHHRSVEGHEILISSPVTAKALSV